MSERSPRMIRFATCLDLLHWTPGTVAAQLECRPALVRRWTGEDPRPLEPPPRVMAWVEDLAQAVRRYPPPRAEDWRVR